MHKISKLIALFIAVLFTSACSSHQSNLQLIDIAQKSLSEIHSSLTKSHNEILEHYNKQTTQLANAFDNDAKAVEEGLIKDSNGQPIKLTSKWVISARKGLTAAQKIIDSNIDNQNNFHQINIDNIEILNQSLEMLKNTIISEMSVTSKIKTSILNYSPTGKVNNAIKSINSGN